MSSLETKDLFVILSELKDVAKDWRYIGLACGMDDNDLDVIDRSNPEIMDKLRKVVRQLINNGCSWEALCDAVSNPLVGNVKLAEKIRKKYVQGRTFYAIEKSNTSIHDEAPGNKDTNNIGQETVNSPLQPLSPGGKLQSPTTPLASPFSSQEYSLDGESKSQLPKHKEEFPSFTPGRVASSKPQTESEMESRSMVESEFSLHSQVLEPMIVSPEASLQMNQEVGENVAEVCQDGLTGPKGDDHTHANTHTHTMSRNVESATSTVCTRAEFLNEKTSSVSSPNMAMLPMSPKSPPISEGQPCFRGPRELSLKEGYELRGYQKELAGPGLRGENYIIVAPTGSGKTLVAGYIIMTHLNKMQKSGERSKVVFMTPTRQLTYQQKSRLMEYIPGLTAVEVTGSTATHMSPLVHGDEVDVIVCTAGKLRRELKTKSIDITNFSLIISDECHHAGRPSNYSDVMEFYVRLKLTQPSAALPQVVGMTASPGAGRGKSNMFTVTEHLFSLCAVLDATSGFMAADRSNPELVGHHADPKSYLEIQDERPPDDPVFLCIYSAMEKLEHYVGNPGVARGTSKYDAWLQNEKEAAESREVDERMTISVLDQLSVYSQALITYKDFRYEDAVSVLNEVEEFKDKSAFESFLFAIHQQLMKELSQLPKSANPLLERMGMILRDQFCRNPQSKGIFFVRTVKHTKYVTSWIRGSSLARLIRVTPITGYSRGGMEKSEQLRVLEGFRKGTYNLLASTSVLEEGLDVPECNFVIRYQNISNEIAQVQAKGRARAEDSRMYTVISSKSNREYWYFMQEEKQRLVESVMSTLKDIPITPHIAINQRKFIEERDREAQRIKRLRSQWPDAENVEILCKKCNVLACKGSEVFAYTLSADDHSHHIVPGESFRTKYEKVAHDKPDATINFVKPYRILCRSRNCRSQWGVIATWGDTGYQFPLLKCEKFLFKYNEQTRRFKKWKDIWFEAKSIQDWVGFEDDIVEKPSRD